MADFKSARPQAAVPMFAPPSDYFRQQGRRVLICLLMFLIAYFLLLVIVTGLAAAFLTGGVLLLLHFSTAGAAIAGIAALLAGMMVLLFVCLFLFSRRAPENLCRVPLQASQHPRLFAFVRQLTTATRVSFPRVIAVVPEVHVHIRFPLRLSQSVLQRGWQLEIGLGLVNSTSTTEFRMVLAHGLTYLSPYLTGAGSYAHRLNRIIYHLLYENESWQRSFRRYGRRYRLAAIFTQPMIKLDQLIYFLLRRLYQAASRSYRMFSRELTFRADMAAVTIAGSGAAVSAIRRMEMSSFCLEHCLHKLSMLAAEQLKFANIFQAHSSLFRYYASRNRLPVDDAGLPRITDGYYENMVRSRIRFLDQYTSQPSREEREARFRALGVAGDMTADSSWSLFEGAEELQEHMTRLLYYQEAPDMAVSARWYSPRDFIREMKERHRQYELPRAFNGYYDDQPFLPLTEFCFVQMAASEFVQYSFDQLYNAEAVFRIRRLLGDRQDIDTLRALADGRAPVSFEFDGQIYHTAQAPVLLERLTVEVNQLEEALQDHQLTTFRYHHTQALQAGELAVHSLISQYNTVIWQQDLANQLNDCMSQIIHYIGHIYSSPDITMEEALPYFEMLRLEDAQLRILLETLTAQDDVFSEVKPLPDKVQHFLKQDYTYLADDMPLMDELRQLHEAASAAQEYAGNQVILAKKSCLEFILALQ